MSWVDSMRPCEIRELPSAMFDETETAARRI